LGLSPYHTLVMGLATGSALKQIYWKLFVNDLAMPAGFSVGIAAYNTILNTLNTAFALWSVTSQQPSAQSSLSALFKSAAPSLSVGIALYAIGIFVEWYCEVQRASFKAKPENKGKPYSDGLFGVVRNVNYTGYTLWRTGYSLVCAGWTWGVLQAAWLAGDFCARAIPSLDTYCEKRYGEQWDSVRRKVPYKFFPGVY
jgi:protein-S-isoprenylcysteine O-methyltransferase Ste14